MAAQCTVGLAQGRFTPSATIDKGATEKVIRPESMAPAGKTSVGGNGVQLSLRLVVCDSWFDVSLRLQVLRSQ